MKKNEERFYVVCDSSKKKRVWSADDAMSSKNYSSAITKLKDMNKLQTNYYRLIPYYEDVNDISTLRWIFSCYVKNDWNMDEKV